MSEPELDTDPPPSPEARALRAIGRELDAFGEVVGELSAGVDALAEMGRTDAQALGRIERDIAQILAVLTHPESGLVRRVGELESWRGEHERAHVRQ